MKKLLTITALIVPLFAFSQRWSYVTNDTFEVPEHTAYWSNSVFYVVADTSFTSQPLTIMPPSGYTVDGATSLDIDYGDKGTIIAMHTDTFALDVVIDYVIPINDGRISDRNDSYDIASANTMDISVTNSDRMFVSGTTTINLMSTTNRRRGDEVTLVFAGSLTVTNNSVSAGTDIPFALAGAANFSATANDVLTLIHNGSKWVEKSRSVN
jgi:hypothetical protein